MIPPPTSRQERVLGRLNHHALMNEAAETGDREATIEQFMRDYAGDPYVPSSLPEIIRHDYRYDRPILSSISDGGVLVHVRGTYDGQAPRDNRYFVATCDIATSETTEWRVKPRYVLDNDDRPYQTDLILTKSHIDLHHGYVHLPERYDDPAAELAWREYEAEQQRADFRQTRLIMSRDCRFVFKPFDGEMQPLTSLLEYRNDQARYEALCGSLGRVAGAHATDSDGSRYPVAQ